MATDDKQNELYLAALQKLYEAGVVKDGGVLAVRAMVEDQNYALALEEMSTAFKNYLETAPAKGFAPEKVADLEEALGALRNIEQQGAAKAVAKSAGGQEQAQPETVAFKLPINEDKATWVGDGPRVNGSNASRMNIGRTQQFLKKEGYEVEVTGEWDHATRMAVLDFQEEHKAYFEEKYGQPFPVDAIIGPKTAQVFNDIGERKNYQFVAIDKELGIDTRTAALHTANDGQPLSLLPEDVKRRREQREEQQGGRSEPRHVQVAQNGALSGAEQRDLHQYISSLSVPQVDPRALAGAKALTHPVTQVQYQVVKAEDIPGMDRILTNLSNNRKENSPAIDEFNMVMQRYRNTTPRTMVDLSGYSFRGADLRNADFSETILTDVKFNGAKLQGAWFEAAIGSNVDFRNTNMAGRDPANPIKMNNAVLVSSDFSGVKMQLLQAQNGIFVDGKFDRAQIIASNLEGSNFSYSSMQRIRMNDVRAGASDARYSLFTDVHANDAKLVDVRFDGARGAAFDLSGKSKLITVSFGAHSHFGSAQMPGLNLEGSRMQNVDMDTIIAPLMNASNLTAINWTMRDADARGINLQYSKLQNPEFENTNFAGRKMKGLKVNGKEVSLGFFGAIDELFNAPATDQFERERDGGIEDQPRRVEPKEYRGAVEGLIRGKVRQETPPGALPKGAKNHPPLTAPTAPNPQLPAKPKPVDNGYTPESP